MLTVIPGMSYLKTLVPCAPMAPLTHTSDTSAREMRVPPDLHHATVLLVTVPWEWPSAGVHWHISPLSASARVYAFMSQRACGNPLSVGPPG